MSSLLFLCVIRHLPYYQPHYFRRLRHMIITLSAGKRPSAKIMGQWLSKKVPAHFSEILSHFFLLCKILVKKK